MVVKHKASLFTCKELITEIERVLQYKHLKKYKINVRQSLTTVKEIGSYHELIYPIKNYVPQDKDDSYVIALALQTNSGYVTSGDSHILSAKEALEKRYTKLKIITKAEFEERFT